MTRFNTDDDKPKSAKPIETEGDEDFGTCCVCRRESTKEHPVRNIICLDFKHPVPGDGWGCVTCGLPPDGAVAAICDRCLEEENFNYKEIVAGLISEKRRIPYPKHRVPFHHDKAKHSQIETDLMGAVPDPSWDYSDVWQQLSRVFQDLSKLQVFISDQETATTDTDLHIYTRLRETATKLNVMADLLIHPIEESDEF